MNFIPIFFAITHYIIGDYTSHTTVKMIYWWLPIFIDSARFHMHFYVFHLHYFELSLHLYEFYLHFNAQGC